ncbi:hypothetical protein FisN_5Lu425 [Fistulifera solaris]|uniref:Uncharacterized protein n=1 Tax=Fistulifera solaris TaxID=1519565 RepID=A0A1Z5KGW2_FISSO|nr:hypothetical protein FisN_5Lu425 [Fistulifera solaris]|eukprot:GAX25332.1 hypothetical protein FisN_5Lu425 [Fistulifera solaris]
MKLSPFTLTAFLFGSASADFNFHAAANQLLGTKNADNGDVRVVVHGMRHEATADNITIIGKAVQSASNKAYCSAGYTMDSFKAESVAAVPELVGLSRPDCRLCPKDDDDVMAVKDTKRNGQMVLGFVQVGWIMRNIGLLAQCV